MKDITSTILIILFGLLILYLNYKMIIRLVSYFSNNLNQAIKFLEEKNLKLIEIRIPSKDNWRSNPFKSKDSYFFEIVLPFSLLSHRIIVASNKKGKLSRFWMRTSSPLIGKISTEYKLDKSKIKKEKIEPDNIFIIKDICPACSTKLTDDISECPECGLFFN